MTSGDVVQGGLHGEHQHMFCAYCMTWMFTRPAGMGEMFINLRPTMLDQHEWFEPYIETYADERLPWARTPAKHTFAKLPEMSAYEGLTREFAEKGARPS